MHARVEWQIRNVRVIYIGESHPGMLGENMPAAELAPLAIARFGLVIRADVFRATGDAYGVGLPKRKGIHGARGPASARVAVAVAHGDRLSGHGELDGSAKTRNAVVVFVSHMRLLDVSRQAHARLTMIIVYCHSYSSILLDFFSFQ